MSAHEVLLLEHVHFTDQKYRKTVISHYRTIYIPDNCCCKVTMKLLMAQLHNIDFLKVSSVVKGLEVVLAQGNESLKEYMNSRMSRFYAVCIFMVVIGKIYGDAGLRDLLIQSGISAEGRVEQLLRGKHYNNAMFAHLCV